MCILMSPKRPRATQAMLISSLIAKSAKSPVLPYLEPLRVDADAATGPDHVATDWCTRDPNP